LRFVLTNKVILEALKPDSAQAIRQLLTIPNPKFQEAERRGQRTGNIPRYLKFYKDTPAGLECPKGAAEMLYNEYRSCLGKNITIVNNTRTLAPVAFDFKAKLRPLQAQAVKGFSQQPIGILVSPTGAGKTVMALYLIAERKQPTLIVVNTNTLLSQWVDRIGTYLGIKAADVGIIGGGKFCIGDKITVGMVQTLHKRAAEVSPRIGHLIVDECHRVTAKQYVKTIEQFDCKCLLGLTATPYRRDKLGRIIQWYLGPITGRIDKQDLVDNGDLCQAEAIFTTTGYQSSYDEELSNPYSEAIDELTQDLGRNKLICRTIKKYHSTGIALILSDRQKHCELLAGVLKKEHGVKATILNGNTPAKEREQIIQDLRSGRCHYLVATGQLIGEGFDLPEISTLALATPLKFCGRLIQYVGRALRPAPGKAKAVILDFVDDHGVFENSARSRWKTYNQQRIEVTGKF
jgi:superfamily II DNA or RNA helicase